MDIKGFLRPDAEKILILGFLLVFLPSPGALGVYVLGLFPAIYNIMGLIPGVRLIGSPYQGTFFISLAFALIIIFLQ